MWPQLGGLVKFAKKGLSAKNPAGDLFNVGKTVNKPVPAGLGFIAKRKKDWNNASPLVKGGMALGAAELGVFGATMVSDMVGESQMLNRGGGQQEAALLARVQRAQLEEQYNQRRTAELTERNATRLAEIAPDVFRSVMAGRMLPIDGVAIGGQPRVDLLEAVAAGMSRGRGAAASQPNSEDALRMMVEGMVN